MQSPPLRLGVPIVISAPSGGGKTTMCHLLIGKMPGVEFSVSHTTRAPRPGERDGVDYYFVSQVMFEQLIAEGAFLEWACVHGNMYGTSHIEASKRLQAGIDVLFDIDVQGGQQIKDKLHDAVLVFVVPPNKHILETRLRLRKSDSEAHIIRRLQAAAAEIKQATFYTHWIINDSLDQAVDDLFCIIRSERLRRLDKETLLYNFLRT